LFNNNEKYRNLLTNVYQIPVAYLDTMDASEAACQDQLRQIEDNAEYNHIKLLNIFHKHQITDFHLNGSTGYGYGDVGRGTLEKVYADLFGGEAALVRSQIVSGTHALALALLGNLRPGQELISAAGKPYDTLQKVIGFHGEPGSLIDSGVLYKEIALTEYGMIDLDALLAAITPQTGMILFQRSKGYQWRPSITIEELTKVLQVIKKKHPEVICLVDNCYCELVQRVEPGEAGADLVVGSLIKNPGGALAQCGGYLVGKKAYIEKAACRLMAPGLGLDMGASQAFNRLTFQGLFQAPLIIQQALKGAVLAAEFFNRLGYPVLPLSNAPRCDIVQAIKLDQPEKLIAFCQGIQKACPLDSMYRPEPAQLPGYDYPVIMAGGTFIQGSSIELSADGPLRPPYIAYMQGGISFAQIKLGILLAAKEVSM
jgi:cystathionine beta-lyase family protein involved in aluminum resistance